MLTLDKFEEASEKVKEVTLETKLIYSDFLSDQTGNKVYLKPENMQFTGAYKVRPCPRPGACGGCGWTTPPRSIPPLSGGTGTTSSVSSLYYVLEYVCLHGRLAQNTRCAVDTQAIGVQAVALSRVRGLKLF